MRVHVVAGQDSRDDGGGSSCSSAKQQESPRDKLALQITQSKSCLDALGLK